MLAIPGHRVESDRRSNMSDGSLEGLNYFAEIAASYDRVQPVLSPPYAAGIKMIVDLIPFGSDDPFKFVDLGCGTAEPTARVLAHFRRSEGCCIDSEPEMLRIAKRKLTPYGDRIEVREADITRCALRSCDVMFSAKSNSVIVDKSYLQGAGIHPLLELQNDWKLLFPNAFFFEVASTDKTARERCLEKLRQIHRSGRLRVAPNMGELLRREIHTLNGAGLPSENTVEGLDLDTFFGIRFDDLSRARREALRSTEADFDRGADGLVACAGTLQGRFRGTCEGTTEQRKEAYRRARETVARDPDFITRFFADFVCQGTHAPPGAPLLATAARDGRLGPQWTIYRWLQAQLLYGLELTEGNPGLTGEALTPDLRERLQHDVVDMEYLVLGALQGALASKDKRMRGMFKLLRPQGVLLPVRL